MKHRLLALGLALCLTAALSACGGGGETPAPSAGPSAETLAPSAAPEPSTQPSAAPDPETLPEVEHDALPTQSDAPAADPSPTPDLTADPTAPPSQAPSSEAPAKSVSAADVYAAVSKAASVSYDDATAYIDAFYTTLDTADLADYVLYQPAMSAQIEEIFIARVDSGKLDAVKAACRDRQAAMAEDAAFYVDTGAYVDSYQLVSEGDWVFFCVGANAAGAADAFKSAVK